MNKRKITMKPYSWINIMLYKYKCRGCRMKPFYWYARAVKLSYGGGNNGI